MNRTIGDHSMKKIIFFVLICCLGVSCVACFALADEKQGSQIARDDTRKKTDSASGNSAVTEKITSEGRAHIHDGNIDAARLSAIRAAYAEAVSKASGEDVRNYLLTRSIRKMAEIVMTRASGYINSYRIIREGPTEGNPVIYKVTLEAEVLKAPSSDDDQDEQTEGLKQFLAIMGNPKILIVLQEQSGAAGSPFDKADGAVRESMLKSGEAAIAQAFSQCGYQVITSDDLAASGSVNISILHTQYRDENVADAIKIARAAGADLAMFGNIRFEERPVRPLGLPMTMISAEASAKALITNSGRSVRAFHLLERASAPDRLRARADCMDKLATGIAKSMAWKIPHLLTEESMEMKVVVRGVDISLGYRMKKSLETALAGDMVRFTRMPSDSSDMAEYSIMTGFITISPGEILSLCGKGLEDSLRLISANKYEVVLKYNRR